VHPTLGADEIHRSCRALDKVLALASAPAQAALLAPACDCV